MLGWLTAAAARASRRNRSAASGSVDDRRIIFSATVRPSRASRAEYTMPIPPSPSVPVISYGPTVFTESAIIPYVARRAATQARRRLRLSSDSAQTHLRLTSDSAQTHAAVRSPDWVRPDLKIRGSDSVGQP